MLIIDILVRDLEYEILANLTQEYRRFFYHRRGDIALIKRARARTLQMMITTVLTFFLFWIPYLAMILWYLFQQTSAEKIGSSVQSFLLIFSVCSSCVNPFIYGIYVFNFKIVFRLCCRNSTPQTRITTRANRLQFIDTSHLKVSVKSAMHCSISCPALLQDLKVEDGGPMTSECKCHCSCSFSKIKDMRVSATSQKSELVTHSLDH
ncbi:hypothetical protein CEXT_125981 [Caerostris extrusa]|uniref:G-protein coupled receptors family 1 profile domain-containing protein n=1 Tax=Caerostris extrusa TaxID=172846 RepID=A0AAV4MKN3_CAEEX|nr:hypothetical protein CEXT_125981 [Caerostris extrusa]